MFILYEIYIALFLDIEYMHEENYKGSKRGSSLIDSVLSNDLKNEL